MQKCRLIYSLDRYVSSKKSKVFNSIHQYVDQINFHLTINILSFLFHNDVFLDIINFILLSQRHQE